MTENCKRTSEDTDYGMLPILRHYEERRRYPRVDMRLPAIVSTRDGKVLNVRIRSLSTEGVQIRCNPLTARALHPRGTHIIPGTGATVLLRVDLPMPDGPRTLAAHAQLCYIAVRSHDQIAFGLRFTDIRLGAKKVLAEFILQSLRPAD